MFEPLFSRLSERYHLVAPDYPGFGHSDRPRNVIWTPAAQAELINSALMPVVYHLFRRDVRKRGTSSAG